MKPALLKQRLSNRALAWICVGVLLLSLLPLYALSFYNHASYDDFELAMRARQAWQGNENWLEIIREAAQSTGSRAWEGSYATAFLGALQPVLSNGQLYWLTTVILLTFFLFSLRLFMKQMLVGVLGVDRMTYWMALCAVAFVMIQFVPDLSEAFFWLNGGVAYTMMWSFVILRLGVYVRLTRSNSRTGWVGFGTLLTLLTVIVGGARDNTVVFALMVECLINGWMFWKKRSCRWFSAVNLLLLMVCFGVGASFAPAQTAADVVTAPAAVAKAFYYGFALMGSWFSLPLLVVWALVAWQLSEALHGCAFRFNHPVWITILSVCLFCAQLVPAVYSGQYSVHGQTVNTYFYTFVIMSCALVLYWMGWLTRQKEYRTSFAAIGDGKRKWLRIAAAAAAVVVLITAVVCCREQPAENNAAQTMASISALRSLISGEAQAYDEAMDKREAALNDPELDEVVLEVIDEIPDAFIGDALESEELEEILRMYAEYYEKQRVTVAEGE